MMIKALQAMAVTAGVLGIAACGGKDKKEDTTPDPQPVQAEQEPEPAPEPEPKEPEPVPEDKAELAEVIYFEFDSSDLSDDARGKLQENAEWLKEDDSRVLTIEGHTDKSGTSEYNVALGERRARAAKEYLERLGVEASRVEVLSYGEERPASDDDALNRRSVFVATK